jgi:hypothetical protein
MLLINWYKNAVYFWTFASLPWVIAAKFKYLFSIISYFEELVVFLSKSLESGVCEKKILCVWFFSTEDVWFDS